MKHPFFAGFVQKEVEDFIAGKEDSDIPFQGIQARCDLYLETACKCITISCLVMNYRFVWDKA